MPNPPLDPLADYLEAQSLLETLHNRKGRLLEGAGPAGEGGAASEPLLALVDAGIRKAGALVVRYEQQIEGGLQNVADQADSGRLLFLDVSKRIREFCALIQDCPGELSDEERLRWDAVLEDYASLHGEWVKKIPPEECPPPLE